MAFKKGISGNSNGRKKGIPNKATGLQRKFIQSLLDAQQDKIKKELCTLHGKDYLMVINGLMEFVLPKLQRTEISAQISERRVPLMNIDPLSSPEDDLIKEAIK